MPLSLPSLRSSQQVLLLAGLAAAPLVVVLELWRRERLARTAAEDEAEKQRAAAERQTRLRDEERKGRIRAEKHLRELPAAPSGKGLGDAADGEDQTAGGDGFVFQPIGTFSSCYRSRCGTPRQGGIVPESLAVLHCVRDLNPTAALEGFQEFSHCWVLYVFHENTNLQREGRTVARRRQNKGRVPLWQGLCMKVAPPRCPDIRVGVLSCRTPHRPNPIGLSLARIVKVDPKRGEVVLAGLDVVDGTPCLDLKPYLPGFESIPTAAVPSWVQASHEEPMMIVRWGDSAEADLTALLEGRPAKEGGQRSRLDVKPFADASELRRALEGTLALDIRSHVQKDRHPNPGVTAGDPDAAFFTGDVWFHDLHVTYALLPEMSVQPGGATAWVRIERLEARSASEKP